jgi:hypothetical protein
MRAKTGLHGVFEISMFVKLMALGGVVTVLYRAACQSLSANLPIQQLSKPSMA